MEKESKIIRIADIARMAGVSPGTVDRVIHNRGRVSKANLEKIQAVLEKVNYRPNVMARSLAIKKQYHILAIIPSFSPGQYWEAISEGINKAARELELYNIYISQVFFNQYDVNSFNESSKRVMEEKPDGVLIATLFTESVNRFSIELDEKEIPYTYIDSNIRGNKQLAYFGTESRQCGLIAAKLLLEKVGKEGNILIAKIANNGNSESTQRRNRQEGFYDYLNQSGYKGNVYQVELKLNDPAYNFTILDEIFSTNPAIKGFTIFTSTCYLLGDYIKARKLESAALIGYDLVEKNRRLLSEGVITTLIAQRPEAQGYFGIKSISNHLLFNKIPEKINLMPIDIIIRENLDYYINSKL